MSKRTTIRLVPTLQKDLSELAEEMGVSYNQLVNYALARFAEAQKGLAIIEERARRGSKAGFQRVLKKAQKRDKKPEKEDTLPSNYSRKAFLARLEKMKAS
jgi:predicted transcriptional regulator